MRTFKTTLLACALTSMLASTVLDARADSLQEAIAKALNSHPEIGVALNNKRAIAHEWRQARAGYFPTVDLTVASGHEHSNNNTTRTRAGRGDNEGGHRSLWRNESTLSVNQMLFDGMQTHAQTKQQRARYYSARMNVEEIRENTLFRVANAYLNVIRNQELLQLAQQNLDAHNVYVDQVGKRSRSGRGSEADLRQAEGRKALAEANFLTARGQLQDAISNYYEVVGENPVELQKPESILSALPENLSEAVLVAMEDSPAILSAQYDIDAAVAAKKETYAPYMPRFDVELAASRNQNLDGLDGANNEASALVRMSYNLYRGGADVAREKERVARLAEAREALERDRRLVRESVENAWTAYEVADRRLEPLRLHVVSAEETQKAYRSQFDIGQRTLLDLLDSQIEQYNAKVALTNALYDREISAYEVLSLAGSLRNALGLEPADVEQQVAVVQ